MPSPRQSPRALFGCGALLESNTFTEEEADLAAVLQRERKVHLREAALAAETKRLEDLREVLQHRENELRLRAMRLDEEFMRIGRAEPNHNEDKIHDQYVGAACEMMLFGTEAKAEVVYNRWAAMAGYAPISIVNRLPLCVDIQSALLCFQGEDFYILKTPERH